MYNRISQNDIVTTRKSVLLLGPRQVGKSTLMRSLEPNLTIDLSDELEYLNHSSDPGLLKNLIESNKPSTVFIDEIQRLPQMLNTIQSIIDRDKKIKFYLTGSSARKLKRGGANLLPGRMINFHMGPLIAGECDYGMNTRKALEFGTLPEIYSSEDQKENARILKSYSANYIKEEIKAEALVRNLESFTRFFQEAQRHVGNFVDYTKMAKHAKISRHAVPRYFEILEDTLVGHRVFSFPCELELIKHPRFYFFDNGVYNGLLQNFTASQDRAGVLAEQLVYGQLLHSSWARDVEIKISSFRTREGIEVDFVFELNDEIIGIEVKSTDKLIQDDFIGLNFLKASFPGRKVKLFIFHMATRREKRGDVEIIPWQEGLKTLGL